MWTWVRFLLFPWWDAIIARRERDEAFIFAEECAFVTSSNLTAVVMAAGSSVWVPDEVIDFVNGGDVAVCYYPEEGGVRVALSHDCGGECLVHGEGDVQ